MLRNCFGKRTTPHLLSLTHSLTLISKYRFTGHSAQVAALYWKINDEVLIVQCRDGNSHIWQLRTSHLDRIESGQTEDDIIQGYDFKLEYE